MVKNIRTIVIPQHGDQTYTTEWSYDTWNRLTGMVYPDGEKVEYTYNAGGLLHSMKGKKKGSQYNYVEQLGYDKFEQRVYLAYGNGTKTTYEYEPERRRLHNMVAKTASGRAMMDNIYEYDKVNNILSLKNNAPIPTSSLMGGSSEYHYKYDELYRLTEASGSFKGSTKEHRYNLQMSYNTVGGIESKAQTHERKGGEENEWNAQKKTTYSQTYEYGQQQPNAPIHIGDQAYSYDPNGNQTGWTHDVSGQRRQILWDEENRIRTIYDNGAAFHYTYDASGERVLKGRSSGQSVYVNNEHKGGSGNMGNYTVYVNPYIVLKSGGYSKHYYIEGQRIVSKLGHDLGDASKGQKAGGDGKVNYPGKQEQSREGIVRNLKFLGQDGALLTAGNSGKTPPGQIIGDGTGSGGGNSGGGKDTENFQYYYHPDHLGSSSYITDASGEVYQHLEYFAFGETFVEEHINTNRTPYLYNGKELDEETGLYYYGARYYDPRTSVWLAVDPLVENHPGIAGYTFVANNPIVLVDPDGLDWFHYQAEGDEHKSWHWHEGKTYDTGKKDENGNNIILQGTEAVVIFRGSRDEQLGEGDNLYGEGAKLAEVMVLGPGGPDDIQFYEGYTMSSNRNSYGKVDSEIFDGNYDAVGKSGELKSNWAINERGRVPALDNVNPYRPNQIDENGNAYLTGVFIHRSNRSGYAGGGVSKGCLLIAPGRSKSDAEDYVRFNNQMSGVTNFKVEVNRDAPIRTPRFNPK